MRRKKQKTGKIIFTLLLLVALVIAGFCIYKFFFEPINTEEKNDQKDQTSVQQTPNPTPDPDPTPNPDSQKEIIPEEIKNPVQYAGENPNENEKLTGVITYAGATSNNVIIRVNIDQYIASGSCKLSLIKNDTVKYEENSNLIADVSTSTCEGFNIARGKLENGNYIIRIELASDGKTGTISGELNI